MCYNNNIERVINMLLLGVLIFNTANLLLVLGTKSHDNVREGTAEGILSFFYYFIVALIIVLGFKLPAECGVVYAVLCLVQFMNYLLFWKKKWYSRCLMFTMIQFCTKKEIL